MALNSENIYAGKQTSGEFSQHTLSTAIQEYNTLPPTPELLTKVWQTFWDSWTVQGKTDFIYQVPACDITAERLEDLRLIRQMASPPLPPQLRTAENRYLFAQMFPAMDPDKVLLTRPHASSYPTITEINPAEVWFDTEASLNSPYNQLNEAEALAKFKNQGREGLTLNEYVIVAQFLKLTAGKYPDERTFTRLLNSLENGKYPVGVYFLPSGKMICQADMMPLAYNDYLRFMQMGWRSKGFEKTA